MPKILIFGDVHGHFDTMIGAINPGTDFVLQVGDFGAYLPTGNLSALPTHRRTELGQFAEYFASQKSFPVPTYFCKGNHEDFDLLARYAKGDAVMPNLYYVPNGNVMKIQGVHIGFLGDNFSSKWFDEIRCQACAGEICKFLKNKKPLEKSKGFCLGTPGGVRLSNFLGKSRGFCIDSGDRSYCSIRNFLAHPSHGSQTLFSILFKTFFHFLTQFF